MQSLKKHTKELIKEFDLIMSVLGKFHEDEKCVIVERYVGGKVVAKYDCSKLCDLQRLYIEQCDIEKLESRIELFVSHFIDNRILAQSFAGLVYESVCDLFTFEQLYS